MASYTAPAHLLLGFLAIASPPPLTGALVMRRPWWVPVYAALCLCGFWLYRETFDALLPALETYETAPDAFAGLVSWGLMLAAFVLFVLGVTGRVFALCLEREGGRASDVFIVQTAPAATALLLAWGWFDWLLRSWRRAFRQSASTKHLPNCTVLFDLNTRQGEELRQSRSRREATCGRSFSAG